MDWEVHYARAVIVAGIDIGGSAKGFHAVALRDGAYLGKSNSCDPLQVAEWCRRIKARFIGVDARAGGVIRVARVLQGVKLMAGENLVFSPPSREAAEKLRI